MINTHFNSRKIVMLEFRLVHIFSCCCYFVCIEVRLSLTKFHSVLRIISLAKLF
uniref:Uncharacterized protein n=1 Tax=Heterorhabditis bacteriophora TaxID=37862 RepID=A0A1I7W9B3_HETBA